MDTLSPIAGPQPEALSNRDFQDHTMKKHVMPDVLNIQQTKRVSDCYSTATRRVENSMQERSQSPSEFDVETTCAAWHF